MESCFCGIARTTTCTLAIHARYTRVEILAAFGIGTTARVAPWQSGVYWANDAQADLFAFTLDKTSGSFSPTTRYKDYAVSRDLIHWESQSVTRAESPTGQRYQHHTDQGTSVPFQRWLRKHRRISFTKMSGCSNAAKFRAALELIPVDDVLYACSARTGVPMRAAGSQ
jgi:hypothetical protein